MDLYIKYILANTAELMSDNHYNMKIRQFIVDCRMKLRRTIQIYAALTIFNHDRAMWQAKATLIHSQEKYSIH